MRYARVVATERGGPDVLRVAEDDLPDPDAGEVRIEVLAAPVSRPDVEARYGHSPFPPRTPFVPGYAVVGDVDAVGHRVDDVAVGDRVAALTVYGGYAEYASVGVDRVIPVPADLDPVSVAPLLLHYLVAHQMLHRSASVEAGDAVLFVGASGGVGTAFLQLGGFADLRMYGLASLEKHHVLREYGATPIDYHTEDCVSVIRDAEPDGLDAVFDGVGGDYVERACSVLGRGGTYVSYANPGSVPGLLRLLWRVGRCRLWPNGRSATLYGTGRVRLDRRPFEEDWQTLFELLASGEIEPIVDETYPLLEAPRANEELEGGDVVGSLVLVSPRLSGEHVSAAPPQDR